MNNSACSVSLLSSMMGLDDPLADSCRKAYHSLMESWHEQQPKFEDPAETETWKKEKTKNI